MHARLIVVGGGTLGQAGLRRILLHQTSSLCFLFHLIIDFWNYKCLRVIQRDRFSALFTYTICLVAYLDLV